MTIDIVLVTFNRLEFTKKTIASLKRTSWPHKLIVVDNGSVDGTREFLLEHSEDWTLVLNDENLGLENALNEGLAKVRSTPFFVTVDNDCIAPIGWLEKLVGLMVTNQEYAAIALRPQVLIGVGPIFRVPQEQQIVENNVVGGSYRIMRTEAIRSVGGWTPKFEKDGRGNEEHDVCGKLRAAGWKVGYAKNLWTYHMFGDEGTWGYDKNSNYKMGRVMDGSPADMPFNPETCEPHNKGNE